jgi:uncharacterized membrane protein
MSDADPYAHTGRKLGFDRLVFFSDAVFAIAITLLVLDLKPPVDAHGQFDLAPVAPNLIAFGLSFYVVGRYWQAHHFLFTGLKTYSRGLLMANLAFLASIAFLPFPTRVVAEFTPAPGPVVFYDLSLAAVGVLLIVLTLVARRAPLMREGATAGGTAMILCGTAAVPITFGLCAFVAIDRPRLALYLIAGLIPISWICGLVGRQLQRAIDGKRAPRPEKA